MKSTKRIISLLLTALMLLAVVSCGDDEKTTKVIDDTSILGMSFSAPEKFETVERAVEVSPDGKLKGKNITYMISDDSALAFAFTDAEGHVLEDELGDAEVERKEYNGTELILYKSGSKTRMAFYQSGENVYGIQYRSSDTETLDDEFDKILQTVKFTEKTETALNNTELDKVEVDTATDVALYSVSTDMEENQEGTLLSKKFIWTYSADSEKTDYRFGIEEYIDSKLEDILKEDKEYEDVKIGDVTYKVEKGDENADVYDHYNFYIQHGKNVYVIQNKGVSNGWYVTRSDESKVAFKTFINSVKFK